MSSRIYRCEFNIRILIKFCNTDHRNVLNKMIFGIFALMLKFDHWFHDQCKNASLLSQFVILCRLLCQGNSAIVLLTQTQKSCLHQSNFQLSVESKPVLHWFCFSWLCDRARKLALLSQTVRRRTKTNHNLVSHVFPRFGQFGWFNFNISSRWLLKVSSFLLIGRCGYYCFDFTILKRKVF